LDDDCGLAGSDVFVRCFASFIAISVPSAERDACERLVEAPDGRTSVPPLDVLVVAAERRIHEILVAIVRELRTRLIILKIYIYNNEKKKKHMNIFILYKETKENE
jgi:hypothetical protein